MPFAHSRPVSVGLTGLLDAVLFAPLPLPHRPRTYSLQHIGFDAVRCVTNLFIYWFARCPRAVRQGGEHGGHRRRAPFLPISPWKEPLWAYTTM